MYNLLRKPINYVRRKGRRFQYFDIPINHCVHYCGFQYGANQLNPYENYIVALSAGHSINKVRRQFIDFLMYYRPRTMGDALDIKLSRPYPLWIYPWIPFTKQEFNLERGWFDTPNQPPDILTYFCEQGILTSRIDQEFYWLEQALYDIRQFGYLPDQFGYAQTMQFCKAYGQTRYLVLDGNHRLSALVALGFKTVRVQQSPSTVVRDSEYEKWFGVQAGFYTPDDALHMFNAYFERGCEYRTTLVPAMLIAPTGWKELYEI